MSSVDVDCEGSAAGLLWPLLDWIYPPHSCSTAWTRHASVVKRLPALAWTPSYHRDIASMANQVMTAQPKRAYIEICQPNWSTSKAKIVGENALTRRIGVAINPNTVPYPW